MLIKGKKAAWFSKETGELILGAITTIAIILLFLAILSPTYNEREEGAKSYYNILEEQLNIAEKEETGTFQTWPLPKKEEQTNYYLIHFKEKITIEEGKQFTRQNNKEPQLCICSEQKETTTCHQCKTLKKPATKKTQEQENNKEWTIKPGTTTTITYNKKTNTYTFKTKN